MLWFISINVIVLIALFTSTWLFRRHRRDAAYMALMLAELLPTEVLRDLPFALPSSLRWGLIFACLLAWLLTVGLYILTRPAVSQRENHEGHTG